MPRNKVSLKIAYSTSFETSYEAAAPYPAHFPLLPEQYRSIRQISLHISLRVSRQITPIKLTALVMI